MYRQYRAYVSIPCPMYRQHRAQCIVNTVPNVSSTPCPMYRQYRAQCIVNTVYCCGSTLDYVMYVCFWSFALSGLLACTVVCFSVRVLLDA